MCNINWCRFFPWPCTCKLLRVEICRQVMTSSQEQDHCATSGGVRCVCWCGKSCDHHGASETRGRSDNKKECKLKKEPRRDEKFCLAGFCERKKKRTGQNERPTLFQVRHVHVCYYISYFRYMFTYVITVRISGTKCLRVFSQLKFQVRHINCVIIPCTSGAIYTYVTIACSKPLT